MLEGLRLGRVEISKLLGKKLGENNYKLAVAESITGGALADNIVSTSGASRYFTGGVVAYANKMKHKILDVEWNLLVTRGSVDEEVAYQMAFGVRKLFDTDCAISTTGFADSGLSAKEDTGLVFVGILTPKSRQVIKMRLLDENPDLERNQVREFVVLNALTALYDSL
ncbi:MAG: CinA family protein [Candidatus Ancillula trichonymphae]|jgi:PncC family amidohydrolase|nr:CinA family protein [Candidatus Ancillula trichonymphae]